MKAIEPQKNALPGVHEVSAPINIALSHSVALEVKWWHTPKHRGAKSTKRIIGPRGWPQTQSQESARAKAVMDDEA